MLKINFSRVTSSGRFLPEIDGLRFIAIFFVLTAHTWGNWVPYSGDDYSITNLAWYEVVMQDLLLQGKLGVFLFFAVSGFILALPYTESATINLKQFYLRRLTRLEPPYVLAMTGYFVALCYLGRLDPVDDLPHLLASLTYTHNIAFDAPSVIYMAAWSLEVEFQFYLISPLLLGWLFRLRALHRLLTLLFCIAVFSTIPELIPGLPDTLLYYAHFFFVGILLADFRKAYAALFSVKLKRCDIAAILGFGLLLFTFPKLDASWSGQMGYCVAIGLLVFAAHTGKYFNGFLRMPIIVVVGGMCYTIYLLHGRLLTAAYHYLMKGFSLTGIYVLDPFIMILIMLPPVVAICSFYYVLVERPSMRPNWPSHLWQKLTQGNPAGNSQQP